MKPSDFYVGTIDFFSNFVPGAVGAFFLVYPHGFLTPANWPAVPWGSFNGWVLFIVSSYILGHLIEAVGSVTLDPLYDRSYVRWKRPNIEFFKNKLKEPQLEPTKLKAAILKAKELMKDSLRLTKELNELVKEKLENIKDKLEVEESKNKIEEVKLGEAAFELKKAAAKLNEEAKELKEAAANLKAAAKLEEAAAKLEEAAANLEAAIKEEYNDWSWPVLKGKLLYVWNAKQYKYDPERYMLEDELLKVAKKLKEQQLKQIEVINNLESKQTKINNITNTFWWAGTTIRMNVPSGAIEVEGLQGQSKLFRSVTLLVPATAFWLCMVDPIYSLKWVWMAIIFFGFFCLAMIPSGLAWIIMKNRELDQWSSILFIIILISILFIGVLLGWVSPSRIDKELIIWDNMLFMIGCLGLFIFCFLRFAKLRWASTERTYEYFIASSVPNPDTRKK
ncbi:hypothetical protein BH24BAC1_BH24BAC1_21520 [soil metagenome]